MDSTAIAFTSQDIASLVYALVFFVGGLSGWAVIAGLNVRP